MRSAGLRKLGLTLHVAASAGWFGAVLAFLALTVPALWSDQPFVARSAYVSMDVVARLAILPLCLAALVTGVFQSFISPWGLVRHYWVAFKLALNVLSSVVLVGHTQPIAALARAGLRGPLEHGEVGQMQLQIAIDACAAAVVLLIATVLAVYKPRGVTRYGWRKQQEATENSTRGTARSSG